MEFSLFQQTPGEPIKSVVPNASQMGWRESPGFFCSASETSCNVAERLAGFNSIHKDLPMHELEDLIKMPDGRVADPELHARIFPWEAIKVFVDDFILLCHRRPAGVDTSCGLYQRGLSAIARHRA